MIERYTRPQMGKIWQDENKFAKMMEVEILTCEALSRQGKIPKQALAQIKKKAKFNVNKIKKIEEKTRHDVIAFVQNLSENIGPASRYVHKGLTSSDVIDTALAVQMKEAADILLSDLQKLSAVLKKKAKQYKYTVCIGRTHGIHAEPMTFGLKLALFYAQVQRDIERLEEAKRIISVGKLSGAVGTYAHLDPSIEEYVCKKLGLKPAPIATQVIQRDRHAQYLCAIAIAGATLEKIATEIRHLQKTEVREAEEPFEEGQKGSSAMPHKRNPVICERVTGLARILRANAQAAIENVNLWHERDISHSSVERVIIPDSTIALDYMLNLMIDVIGGLLVYPKAMQENLNKTHGLIFSQKVLILLINKGFLRKDAYDIVQRNAMKVWQTGAELKDLLMKDKAVSKNVSQKEIDSVFDTKPYLKNVDKIFKKVGI